MLLFPEDPRECFDFAAAALDLADRLQTPIFVMTDLDIGMNHRLCEPLQWDDARRYDRGKVMSREELDSGRDFGRYLDVDGDGIPYRTLPGTHPERGAYFTRGTTRDAYARYSEAGPDYIYNVERLLKKFETAKALVPQPVERTRGQADALRRHLLRLDQPGDGRGASRRCRRAACTWTLLRVRAFPFSDAVDRFIAEHETVFVVEQNRDAQLRTMLVTEQEIDPARLVPVLHFDGTPITARFITEAIARADRSGR